jgi:predicted nucleic acid-binding Zn ribbon protein
VREADVVAVNRQTDPRSVSDALDGVVRSLQGGRQRGSVGAAAVGGVFGRWSEIVGDAMAAQVQPVKLDAGRLLVEVREPAWATQVKMLSEQLRHKIKEVAGVDVESIDVRVAGPRR